MSDKPIAARLQVEGARRLAVVGASAPLDQVIGVPERRADLAEAEVVLVVVADRAALETAISTSLANLAPATLVWVAYPKLSSPLAADLNRDRIRTLVLAAGLDTVAQIAIDEDWSALRLKRL